MTRTHEPYERHALYYLGVLRHFVERVNAGENTVAPLLLQIESQWPQVLTAFWWGTRNSDKTTVGKQVQEGFNECTAGDIARLQGNRNSDDVMVLARNLEQLAKKQDNPNNAAFLFRFAGISLTQSRILQMAEETGIAAQTILGDVMKLARNKPFDEVEQEAPIESAE